MTFTDAIKTCFQNYATFRGRAGRPEFWYFVLFILVVNLLFGFIDGIVFGDRIYLGPFATIFDLATLLPLLAVGARRLHDIGKSGWWLLLGLIPLVGAIVLIWWCIQKGEVGENKWDVPGEA